MPRWRPVGACLREGRTKSGGPSPRTAALLALRTLGWHQSVAKIAQSGRERQPAQSGGAVVTLALIRLGDRIDVTVQAAIAKWSMARLVPGARKVVCAACGGVHLERDEIAEAVAIRSDVMDGSMAIAAVCASCARLPDPVVFVRLLHRLNSRQVELANLATAAGSV
jgi:hypothetical protein